MEGAISSARIAVVTGGNKGIGLEVCRQLASNGIIVVLTARDEKRGSDAVDKFKEAGLSNVIFHQLEVTDVPSIARLADFLKARYGKIDILVSHVLLKTCLQVIESVNSLQVNNAAVGGVVYAQDAVDSSVTNEEKFSGMDARQMLEWLFNNCQEPYSAAKECVETNYYGTKHVIEALLPLLQASSDGRIINVSSVSGQLRVLNEELKQELNDVDNLTEERLDELLGNFLKDFEAGEAEARGWPQVLSAYKVAKTTMNSYSRILAKRHSELRINCVHPGYVKTDMTINSGVLTTEEGASNVTKAALLPAGGPTGMFFAMDEEASFV